jgi:hypothetical protein
METMTVTGRLIRMMAIGGETTGWGVALEEPRLIKGATVKHLEIDPRGRSLDGLDHQRVEVTGVLQQRSGVERKGYWVLVVAEIRGR